MGRAAIKREVKFEMICACSDRAAVLDKKREDWVNARSWEGWKKNFVNAALYDFWHNYEAELTYWMDQWMSVTLESQKFRLNVAADRFEDAILKFLMYLEKNQELQA